jgi:hypothetical protein
MGPHDHDPFEVGASSLEKAFNPMAIKRAFTSAGGGMKGAQSGARMFGRQFRRTVASPAANAVRTNPRVQNVMANPRVQNATAAVQANPTRYAAGAAGAGGLAAGYGTGRKNNNQGL